MEVFNILWVAAKALAVVMVLLSLSNLAILAERKVSGWIQGRVGPNRTALPIIGAIPVLGGGMTRLGLFQPLADSLKFALEGRSGSGSRQQVLLLSGPGGRLHSRRDRHFRAALR